MSTDLIERIARRIPYLRRLPYRGDLLREKCEGLEAAIKELGATVKASEANVKKLQSLVQKERSLNAERRDQLSKARDVAGNLRGKLKECQENLVRTRESLKEYRKRFQSLNRQPLRLSERPLSPTAQAVIEDGLTLIPAEKLTRIENAVTDLMSSKIEGDIVEFGIALGGSAIVLAKIAAQTERAFHGFDLFGMIPPPSSDKDDEKSKSRYEAIAAGQSKGIKGATYYGYRPNLYEEVCASFERFELPVDGKNVVLHKGLFEETLPNFHSERIAFAHVDCDWYDPVKLCLESIADRISAGGVIMLDDYNTYGGCRTATHEFLSQHHDYEFEWGPNPILRRKSV